MTSFTICFDAEALFRSGVNSSRSPLPACQAPSLHIAPLPNSLLFLSFLLKTKATAEETVTRGKKTSFHLRYFLIYFCNRHPQIFQLLRVILFFVIQLK